MPKLKKIKCDILSDFLHNVSYWKQPKNGGKCHNSKIQMRHFKWLLHNVSYWKTAKKWWKMPKFKCDISSDFYTIWVIKNQSKNVSYHFWKNETFLVIFNHRKKVFWESPNLFVKLNYSCFKLLLQYWLLWVLHKLSMVCEIVIVIYFIRFFIPKLLW